MFAGGIRLSDSCVSLKDEVGAAVGATTAGRSVDDASPDM